ncbi:MAG: accessory factor UbiK family protein [Gammaproteobacteria bacterium]|nr:accessory factor UbiK family protein [Gammaproteobacteria bacterium]
MSLTDLNAAAEQLRRVLPGLATQTADELRSNLRALVESMLARLNLVTREEFDAQAAMLTRTREKLDQLEAIIAELEKRG